MRKRAWYFVIITFLAALASCKYGLTLDGVWRVAVLELSAGVVLLAFFHILFGLIRTKYQSEKDEFLLCLAALPFIFLYAMALLVTWYGHPTNNQEHTWFVVAALCFSLVIFCFGILGPAFIALKGIKNTPTTMSEHSLAQI
jgi:peptidoglycan/LPS O-acetylase OafA/YrhL